MIPISVFVNVLFQLLQPQQISQLKVQGGEQKKKKKNETMLVTTFRYATYIGYMLIWKQIVFCGSLPRYGHCLPIQKAMATYWIYQLPRKGIGNEIWSCLLYPEGNMQLTQLTVVHTKIPRQLFLVCSKQMTKYSIYNNACIIHMVNS